MRSQLELRRELFSLLAWHMHRTDHSPLDTLLRMIHKSVGPFEGGELRVMERWRDFPDLKRHVGENHAAARPKRLDAPIILFAQRKREYLVDGQNRLNRFNRRPPAEQLRCLIVKFKK